MSFGLCGFTIFFAPSLRWQLVYELRRPQNPALQLVVLLDTFQADHGGTIASHRAYLPFVSSPVARKRYTSPTTAMVRPSPSFFITACVMSSPSSHPSVCGGHRLLAASQRDRRPGLRPFRCAGSEQYRGIPPAPS